MGHETHLAAGSVWPWTVGDGGGGGVEPTSGLRSTRLGQRGGAGAARRTFLPTSPRALLCSRTCTAISHSCTLPSERPAPCPACAHSTPCSRSLRHVPESDAHVSWVAAGGACVQGQTGRTECRTGGARERKQDGARARIRRAWAAREGDARSKGRRGERRRRRGNTSRMMCETEGGRVGENDRGEARGGTRAAAVGDSKAQRPSQVATIESRVGAV